MAGTAAKTEEMEQTEEVYAADDHNAKGRLTLLKR